MIELVTGGIFAGKREYLLGLGYEDKDFGGFDCPIVYKLNDIIRDNLDGDYLGLILGEIKKNNDLIIVCDEVGSGVVPAEPFNRAYREAVGRALLEIGKNAKITRVYCGIPSVIRSGI